MSTTPDRAPALRVDRVACTGHGVCATLLAGRVRLDGRVPAKGSERVVAGSVIEVEPLPAAPVLEPDPSVEVEVVHADDAVVVVHCATD